MKFIDLIHEVSTQTFSLFQERRCVLCHIPFHPKEHVNQQFFQHVDQETLNTAGGTPDGEVTNTVNTKTNNAVVNKTGNVASNETNNIMGNHSDNGANIDQQNTLLQIKKLATRHVQRNLCPDCAKEITPKTKGFCPLCGELFADEHISPTLCANCAQAKPPWDSFIFLGAYKNCLRELLLKAKFHNSNSSLSFLGKLLAYFWLINTYSQALPTNTHINYPSHIIPIPLHSKRLKERGYNQCIELTKFFVRELNFILSKCYGSKFQEMKPKIIIDYTKLIRTNFSHPQSELSSKERMQNVKNAFTAKDMRDKHVLLIDDIATTNSTLKEASLALKKAGASKIDILIVAKASLFSHK